jgi:hypothetical protein
MLRQNSRQANWKRMYFEGLAVNGQLKGRHLTQLPFDKEFWFEWIAFHP